MTRCEIGECRAITLTTGADTLTGTSGNDSFYATAATTTPTYTASDNIDGAAGSDTLFLTADILAANSVPVASVTNVETINFRNVSGNQQTLAASNFVGSTTINNDRSVDAVVVNNVGTQAVGVTGNNSVTNGASTFNFLSSATSATVNVTGGTTPTANTVGGAVTLTGTLPTVTINSTGTLANVIGAVALGGSTTALNINASARLATSGATGFTGVTGFTGTAAKITIAGAAAAASATGAVVTLGALENTTVKTVDASGLTAGGVSLTMNTNATLTITGGQGNDFITTNGLLTTGSVNAGAGTGDRLVVANTADADTSTLGLKYSGFEVVEAKNGVTVDVDNLSVNNTITAVRVNDGAGTTQFDNLTATQAAAVAVVATGVNAAGTSGIVLNVKGATLGGQADTVNLALTTTTTASVAQNSFLNKIALAGVETLNITTTGTVAATTGAVTFTADNATALNTVKLTTVGASNYINFDAVAAANLNFDGSATTGTMTVVAGGYNTTTGATIKGGTAADVIYGSAKADVIDGGAGNDTIYVDKIAAAGEVQTITWGDSSATGTAANKVTVAGVDVTIGMVNAANTTVAVLAAANTIIAANPTIATITNAAGNTVITYHTTTGDVAAVTATSTGGAAVGGVAETTKGIVPGATGTGTAHATGANDVITGGAGNDTFYFVGAANAGAAGVADIATITDLNLGGDNTAPADIIKIDGATPAAAATLFTLSAVQQTAVTAAANLTAAVAVILAASDVANQVTQFTYGGQSYLFVDDANASAAFAAGDTLIKITGVTGTLDGADLVIV